MARKSDPDAPPLLPIKLDPVSNGEYVPRRDRAVEQVQAKALAAATEHAQRTGVSRRDFLASSCGAATVLLAMNELGCGGGKYQLPPEAPHEPAAASSVLGGDELIFDVQTHHVATDRPWWKSEKPNLGSFISRIESARCGRPEWIDCYGRDAFFKEIFLDSSTRLAVLSALWGSPDINALHVDEMALTRERMARMQGSPRLRIHGIVLPKLRGAAALSEDMQALVETYGVAAFKLYPVWGPDGRGWRVDDPELGLPIIERGIQLGVPLFAIHKGLPLIGQDPSFAKPDDIGPAAKAFPQATFLIYHSGYESDRVEGPYNPTADRGVDALITSLAANGIGPAGNVYAELGSLWREVMKQPDQAAHVLGKLLVHLGPDRILWGTDSLWYGSPEDQIQAFRAFQISPELQEKHGYPALTPEIRRKIFGLNAARVYGVDPAEVERATAWDPVARAREEYGNDPAPSFQTYGPRSRRELLALWRSRGGLPD